MNRYAAAAFQPLHAIERSPLTRFNPTNLSFRCTAENQRKKQLLTPFNKCQLTSIKKVTLEISMLRSILVAITLLAAASQQTGFARTAQQHSDSQSSILQVQSETVRVKLLDSSSGDAISNSDVNLHSDTGIVCCCYPCPRNDKEWAGRSDSNGYVVIPTSFLQAVTNIWTPAYKTGKNLVRDSEQDNDGAWVVKLIPNFDGTACRRSLYPYPHPASLAAQVCNT